MTRDGLPNRFGRFVFENAQAERVAAGDMSAVWEFIEQNRTYLTRWARAFVRNRFWFVPRGYYEVDELLNQIFVDFLLYPLESEKTIGKGIFSSFFMIGCGGYGHYRKDKYATVSLDAPASIASRSGDVESGATIGELLASREPTPYAALERMEHVKEIAPKFFAELGKVCGKNGREAFRDVVEEVFFGFTFEEIESYAKR